MARLDDILHNPFRVLRLETTATPRQVTRAADELSAALRIGAVGDQADLLSWVEPLNVTEELVAASRYALQDPQRRTTHQFFWFHFGYPGAEAVRRALVGGAPDQAAGALCADIETGGSEAAANAAHDLGLLRLIAASARPNAEAASDDFARALGLLLASARQLCADESVFRRLCEITLGVVADCVRGLVDSGDLDSACLLYNVLLDCPYRDDLRKAACSLPFGAYFGSLISYCGLTRRKANALDFDGDSSGSAVALRAISKEFQSTAVSPLGEVTASCEFYANDIEPVCDAVLDCAHTLSTLVHYKLSDSQAAYELLAAAEALPASDSKILSIQPELRICGGKALQMQGIEHERKGELDLAAEKYRKASELCDDADTQNALSASAKRCELGSLLRQAAELEKDCQWGEAAARYRKASTLCPGDERAGLIHSAEWCEKKSAEEPTQAPGPSRPPPAHLWNGYVGGHIRRCALNQLLIDALAIIICLYAFGCESYWCLTGEVDPYDGAWALGVLLLILAPCLWYFRVSLKRRKDPARHPIARALARLGPVEDVVTSIDGEVRLGGVELGSAIITKLWFLRPSTFNLDVRRSIDIIWVYKKVTSHSVNFIPTGKSYQIVINCRAHLVHEVGCGGDWAADQTLLQMSRLLPWVIFGYSHDLSRRWTYERDSVVAAVDERRRQAEPLLEFLYPDRGHTQVGHRGSPSARPSTAGNAVRKAGRIAPAVVGIVVALAFASLIWLFFTMDTESDRVDRTRSSNNTPSADAPLMGGSIDSEMDGGTSADIASELPALDTSGYGGYINPPSAEDYSFGVSILRNDIRESDQQLESWQTQLDSWRLEMDQIESDIEALKEDKESMERDYELGYRVDEQAYDSIIDEANDLIARYELLRDQRNALVRKYNALVADRNGKLKRLKKLVGED